MPFEAHDDEEEDDEKRRFGELRMLDVELLDDVTDWVDALKTDTTDAGDAGYLYSATVLCLSLGL